jgi:hypothetical protein
MDSAIYQLALIYVVLDLCGYVCAALEPRGVRGGVLPAGGMVGGGASPVRTGPACAHAAPLQTVNYYTYIPLMLNPLHIPWHRDHRHSFETLIFYQYVLLLHTADVTGGKL